MESFKIVLVGDAGVGKTCCAHFYVRQEYYEESNAEWGAWDTLQNSYVLDGSPVSVQVWDTRGHHKHDKERAECLPETHVIIFCFSLGSEDSFKSILRRWLPRMQASPDTSECPFLFAGLQMDLLPDPLAPASPGRDSENPYELVERIAREAEALGAHDTLNCSAKDGRGVKELFDAAIRLARREHVSTSLKRQTRMQQHRQRRSVLWLLARLRSRYDHVRQQFQAGAGHAAMGWASAAAIEDRRFYTMFLFVAKAVRPAWFLLTSFYNAPIILAIQSAAKKPDNKSASEIRTQTNAHAAKTTNRCERADKDKCSVM